MKTRLECCVCGGGAGRFEQHHNRDTGYGVCPSCVAWMAGRGTGPEEMKDLYGVAGVNYEQPMHTLYGRRFKVLATFKDSEIGTRNANQFMETHPGACLLAQFAGNLILADKDDKGVEA